MTDEEYDKINKNKLQGMTPREVARLVAWKEVKRAIRYHYPGLKKGGIELCETAYNRLKKMRRSKQINEGEVIEVKFIPISEWTEYPAYACNTNQYSLSFRTWAEVGNIPFSDSSVDSYMPEELLTHFIWEITWYGAESDVKKYYNELARRVKEVHESHIEITEEGRKTKVVVTEYKNVCHECGVHLYGDPVRDVGNITLHRAPCEECGEEKTITPATDWKNMCRADREPYSVEMD